MNTITLNGKTYDISDDLAAKLADEIKDQETRDAVAKPKPYQEYFFMHNDGRICRDVWTGDSLDANRYNLGNVCTDRELMQQRAYAETLSRLMWRYALLHGGRTAPGCTGDWYLAADEDLDFIAKYAARPNKANRAFGLPTFASREAANAAIEEVLKPFLREHPDFKWQEA